MAATTGALSAGGCDDRRTKHGREEISHSPRPGAEVGGPHAGRAAAKRRYPTSEVRGSGRECQATTAQERPRRPTQVRGQGRRPIGATLRPRSGVEAERSYPTPPHPRPGAVAGRSNPRPETRGGRWEDQRHVTGGLVFMLNKKDQCRQVSSECQNLLF